MINVEPSFVLYALLLDPDCCLRAHIILIELVEPEGKKRKKKEGTGLCRPFDPSPTWGPQEGIASMAFLVPPSSRDPQDGRADHTRIRPDAYWPMRTRPALKSGATDGCIVFVSLVVPMRMMRGGGVEMRPASALQTPTAAAPRRVL